MSGFKTSKHRGTLMIGRVGVVCALATAGTAFAACSTDSAPAAADAGVQAQGDVDADSVNTTFGDAAADVDANRRCVAPDVLIALDRTLSMHRTATGETPPNTPAGRATSKWWMAIEGIEQLTAPPLDQGVRFGLELWPRVDSGCVTLEQRIAGKPSTNPQCLSPEIVVDTELGAGAKIAQALDPETTPICVSTPTGGALRGARAYLETRKAPDRKQFVALVTDGADWDVSCPTPAPLDVVDELTGAGITTVIVGFSAEAELVNGVGAAFLDDMACAGGAARGFPDSCAKDENGHYRAKREDAGAKNPLFYVATNPTELASNLREVASTICCDCVK